MFRATGHTYTDAVNWVGCPRCKAVAGDVCRTPKGRKLYEPHDARVVRLERDYPNVAKLAYHGGR